MPEQGSGLLMRHSNLSCSLLIYKKNGRQQAECLDSTRQSGLRYREVIGGITIGGVPSTPWKKDKTTKQSGILLAETVYLWTNIM